MHLRVCQDSWATSSHRLHTYTAIIFVHIEVYCKLKIANVINNFLEERKAATLFDLAHIAHSEGLKYGEERVNMQVLNACHWQRLRRIEV